MGENICNHISAKGCVIRIYDKPLLLNIKRQIILFLNGQMISVDIFPKADIQIISKYMKRHSTLSVTGEMQLTQWDILGVVHSVVSDSLWPYGLQHARLPCPSPTPGACSNSCASSRWCHPAISSSIIPFSSCLQSFPTSESFPMNWLFESGGQSIGASASTTFLLMNIQGWFPLGLTDFLAVQRTLKSLPQHYNSKASFFGAQPLWFNYHIHISLSTSLKVKMKSISHVRLFATPWTAACQAPLPMGFSRQEYWSGLPLQRC